MKMTCTGKGTVGMEGDIPGSCLEVESAELEDALKEEGWAESRVSWMTFRVSSGARP